MRLGYTDGVTLLACPFCRELYSRDEAPVCPHCELGVVPLDTLGPSAEALAEMPEVEPGDEPLPWFSPRAWRGPTLGFALLGLVAFRAPWFELSHPEAIQLSGFDLARGNAPWLWGGAIGFFLLVPLLLSRRTPYDLSRIRVIATTFALMTACEVLVLALKPPLEASYFQSELRYLPGFYGSGGLSLLAALGCLFLGRIGLQRRPSEPYSGSAGGAVKARPRAPSGDTLH